MQDDPGDKFSRHWSPVILNTLQIFTLPQTGSSYRGGCIHHFTEVVNDVGWMVDVARKEGLICLL